MRNLQYIIQSLLIINKINLLLDKPDKTIV